MLKKSLATGLVAVASSAGLMTATTVAAHADNTAVSIEKTATRSATGLLMNVRATVVCSPDTTSAAVSATVQQVNAAGGIQTATSGVVALNAVECTGTEQIITIPVRRPTGGYNWTAGTAAVKNVVFRTWDPSGSYVAFLKSRTVTVS